MKTLPARPRRISDDSSTSFGLSESHCPTRFTSHLNIRNSYFDSRKPGSSCSNGSKTTGRQQTRRTDSRSPVSKANRVFRFTLYEAKT